MHQANEALAKLEAYVEAADYKGYDCYDALNSPVLGRLARTRALRMLVIQGMKRFPLNLRPLLGTPKGHNPKGLGLFLAGVAKQYRRTSDKNYLKKLEYLAKLLNSLVSTGYSGQCWGYNFDWQSRVFFVPKGTPTIVNTSYIGHAFLDAYEITGDSTYLNSALGACRFISNDLHRSVEDDTVCFSYTPIDKLKVHNANILGASLLSRVGSKVGDSEMRDLAGRSLNYVMRYQRSDGSWVYAETDIQGWVDSFHTGFILESLYTYIMATGDRSHVDRLQSGYQFYLDHFFQADGTPKYYHDRVYPIDIHSAAQGIVTMTRLAEFHPSSVAVREKVLQWTLDHLFSDKGYFYFQKHRTYTNKIPYIRWSQAWMFHALTTYLEDKQVN